MNTATTTMTNSAGKGWHIGLWVAQVALAALFGMGVYMHLFMAPADMAAMGAVWVETAPIALVRFIGLAELAGVIGLILPAATRIKPKLTVYAAWGLLTIQILAIGFHAMRGEFEVLAFNAIYVVLAVLVIWGRTRKAPIAARD